MTSEELYQEAVEHVLNNPALHEYRYVLLDDPFLDGPTTYEHDFQQQEFDKYYHELLNIPSRDLLELAVSKTYEFKDFINYRLEECAKEITVLKTSKIVFKLDLKRIEKIILEGRNALAKYRLEVAAGYLHRAIRDLERYCFARHERPLIEKAQKVDAGAKKGAEERWKIKRKEWPKFQDFIDDLHLNSPLISNNDVIEIVAKNFKVSPKTIRRHTKSIKNNEK